jgi:glutamine synthetase
MLGSSESISCANVFLNTAVAEELSQFADQLEKSSDFKGDLHKLILKTIKEHKRIIFNGNGYDDSWVKEAEKRGLYNLKSTPEALQHTLDEKNVSLFEKHGVYSKVELESRNEIHYEHYSKILNIEALTMIDMTKKLYLPAGAKYAKFLADSVAVKKTVGAEDSYEKDALKKVSELTAKIYAEVQKLEGNVEKAGSVEGAEKNALFYRNEIFSVMGTLREAVDELEEFVPAAEWPVPSYGDLLYSVK